MLILLEGIALCFILLVICVVGIAKGAVGCVYFYEPDVQERVVKLGLTTKEKIKSSRNMARIALLVPLLVLVPWMVYFVNGAREFWDLFLQITAILGIEGLFDRSLSIGIGCVKQKHGSFPAPKIYCRIFQRKHGSKSGRQPSSGIRCLRRSFPGSVCYSDTSRGE